ncbi:MAG: hypothetical protein ABSC10_06340 [Candidatus Acidiferrales bacterium]|jgi:hypothetical protein
MKNQLFFVLLAIVVMSGCASGRLYPVQGPLAAQSPIPVYTAKFSGPFSSGHVSVVLAGGEVCKGSWSAAPSVPSAADAGSATTPATSGTASLWDTVYGPGFYQAHVLGTRIYMRATPDCNHGTTLTVEMFRAADSNGNVSAIRGVAQDNKGNIYKVTF